MSVHLTHDMRRQTPATIAMLDSVRTMQVAFLTYWETSVKKLSSILLVLVVAGCDGSPESKAKLRALGKASCAMSMHCDPATYETTANGWSQSSGQTGGAITIGGASLCPLNSNYGFLVREETSGMNKICYYK